MHRRYNPLYTNVSFEEEIPMSEHSVKDEHGRQAEATSLSEMVYQHIWNKILNKELSGGDKLAELQIMKEMNISRTPVREAIQRFIGEGLAESVLNHSARLITIDDEFLTELGIMRLSADILAVRLAIYNGSNRDFDELQQIAEDCLAADRSGNTLERIEKDIAFHRKLALISRNRFLAETIDRLQKKNQLYFVETASSSDDIKDSLDQHFQIVRALKARDIDASIACAAEHLIPYYHIQKAIADTGLFSYL